jgi:hypothetical protein
VRYKVLLRDAAQAEQDTAVARLFDGAIEAPPSTWLLRPARARLRTPFRFRVTTAPGDTFVSGVFPSSDAPGTYEGFTDDHYQLAYAAFGRLRVRDLDGGRIRVAMLPGPTEGDDAIGRWVETSARAVEGFYGALPVAHLLILVRPTARDSVGFGTTMGHSGAAISIDVGAKTSPADFRDDWILVHEMVHTALPDLEGPQHWLEEGLATYVEPIARRRAGLLTTEHVWAEWVREMPHGLPAEGDRGLDRRTSRSVVGRTTRGRSATPSAPYWRLEGASRRAGRCRGSSRSATRRPAYRCSESSTTRCPPRPWVWTSTISGSASASPCGETL